MSRAVRTKKVVAWLLAASTETRDWLELVPWESRSSSPDTQLLIMYCLPAIVFDRLYLYTLCFMQTASLCEVP